MKQRLAKVCHDGCPPDCEYGGTYNYLCSYMATHENLINEWTNYFYVEFTKRLSGESTSICMYANGLLQSTYDCGEITFLYTTIGKDVWEPYPDFFDQLGALPAFLNDKEAERHGIFVGYYEY